MNTVYALEPSPTLPGFLAETHAFLCRYVAFPSEHEPVAVALWVAHAHIVEHFETSPILAVTSAEKRSGKTRLLDCLELLVPHPFRAVIPSEALVYTILSQRPRRTLLLDEADAIFGPRSAERYEGLRAILNAGNRKGTGVPRLQMEGRKREILEFDIYGPKAVAGIGKLPDTVSDRAIPIRMKRRAPGERIERFRRRTAEADAKRIPGFLVDEVVPDVPDVPVPGELNDRAADGWEPLLALAAEAGGDWPERARLAAIALSGDEELELSTGMRLLADIREVFGERDHLLTADLLQGLHQMDEAPWSEWYGKALTARGLARLLEPYRVVPLRRRVDGHNLRGYFTADFADAWQRYLPGEPEQAEKPEQTPTLSDETLPFTWDGVGVTQ